jgi:multiple sugar transport system substrate-binding protein
MQSLVDAFNAANPNIKVTMTTQADIATALGTAQASGTLPDLTQINEDVVATRAFQGIIRPMDETITAMGIQKSDFPAVAWGAGTINGKQYAVPLSFVAMTMYYNNDLLSAAGMTTPPTNQADFEKVAAAMTANGNNGFMITSGFPAQQIFQQLLHQYGGSEFAADGSSATWNSDAGVQALTWMVNAQKNYAQPALPVDADVNGFKTGAVGMIWNGSWQLPNLTGTGVGFAGMAAAPPQIGPSPATWAGGALLAVTTARKAGDDACKDAAGAMFYRYLIDHAADWAKAGNIPAYTPARNSEEFKANPLAPLSEAVNNPVFPPPIPGVGDAFAPLGDAVAAVMLGNQTDIKKALDDSAAKSNQILAQNAAKYGTAPPEQ